MADPQPNPSNKKLTRPGSKTFDQPPSLECSILVWIDELREFKYQKSSDDITNQIHTEMFIDRTTTSVELGVTGVEMGPGPDLTRAYFWPTVNKRPDPSMTAGYFLNQPKEISFEPKGKKLKQLGFLGEIFETQTQTKDGWPEPKQQKVDLRCVKNFTWSHH